VIDMTNRSKVATAHATRLTNQEFEEVVKKSFDNAVQMMMNAGYEIPNDVKVTVDPQLPFMGYTMPTRQGFNIVVTGGAVESGMLEGLLMHEMGHIYRISTNHPSHNAEILEEAFERLGTNLPDYQ
jgi:Zn-dependent protease with chaperone function